MSEIISIEDLIIEYVEKENVLWDPTHINYRKNDIKNQKWNEITEKINIPEITVEIVKAKWKSIVNSYRTSKKKAPSGSAAGRKKRYRRDLSFLDSFMVSENAENRTSSFQGLVGGEVQEGLDINSDSMFEELIESNTESQQESIVENRTISRSATPSTSRSYSRSEEYSDPIDKLVQRVDENWDTLTKFLNNNCTNKSSNDVITDEIYYFCISLTKNLRSLNSINLSLCQAEIHQVIAKYLSQNNDQN
uniref:CSON006132 protein n=1 Tax=Culicoides sonorensis TaxID=179676 RepID=A0A336LZF3_CULSO